MNNWNTGSGVLRGGLERREVGEGEGDSDCDCVLLLSRDSKGVLSSALWAEEAGATTVDG